MLVLDTSALIYWTLDPMRMSQRALRAIEESGTVVISSISVWEIALKVKRQKIIIPITINDYVKRLERIEKLDILSVDVQTWLGNLELPWEHRDPADRTIVALATRYKCPLVSSDQVIALFYPKTIW